MPTTFPVDWGRQKKSPGKPRGGKRAGAGRPVNLKRCPRCGREMTTRMLRNHPCCSFSPYAEVAKHLALAWDIMQEFPAGQYDSMLASTIANAAQRLWHKASGASGPSLQISGRAMIEVLKIPAQKRSKKNAKKA